MNAGYLLDTNHLSRAVTPRSSVRQRIAALRQRGVKVDDLRRRGRVLSQVDMMVAALARQMALTVATSDQDFAALPDIVTEDWTGVSP